MCSETMYLINKMILVIMHRHVMYVVVKTFKQVSVFSCRYKYQMQSTEFASAVYDWEHGSWFK